MLKEIGIKEALKIYINGEDVLTLEPPPGAPAFGDTYQISTLSTLLDGVRFLVHEEPDEVVFADEPPIETDDTAPETVSEETLREMGVDLTK